jgi:uncharacterized protein (TIRG00374 family)
MRFLVRDKRVIFVAIACLGILLLASQLLNTQGLTLRDTKLRVLVIYGLSAIALQMAGHWLRAVKHRYLLEQIRPIHTREVFKGQMIGLLFNTILPFRLGELVRAHYIGKGVSISRSAVFATILFERLLDTVVLICIGIVLLINIPTAHVSSLAFTVSLLSFGALLLAVLLWAARTQQNWLLRAISAISDQFNVRLRDRIRMMCWSAIYCLKNVITARRMPRYLTLTGIMWICYLTSAYALIAGILPSLSLLKRMTAAVAVYFGVSIPSGPAYIGTFRTLFSNISTVSVALLNSTHAAFALWLLLILPTTLLGLCFLFTRQRIYNQRSKDSLDVLRNKLYRDADITKEFSHFLDAYFKGDKINRILTAEELASNFQVLKTFKGGSNASTLLAWQDEKMVVKKITLKQYETKLRAQYLWLKEHQHLPEISRALKEHRSNDDYYAIDIEYRDEFVPFFDVIHSSSDDQNKKVLRAVCVFVDKRLHKPKRPIKDARRILKEYIRTKAAGKVTDAANANLPISHLLTYATLTVNGREIKNFQVVIDAIMGNKKAMADLTEVIECPIQGDLTIDNLIVNPTTSNFIILDPNNENTISDPVVDYAKLMQSLHSGYEFLFSLPSCTVADNQINFEERRSVQYDVLYKELCKYLHENLTPGRYRAILFHEAIHYCRMLTYRTSINPDTAAAFYCIAVRLFNDFLEQYNDTKVLEIYTAKMSK